MQTVARVSRMQGSWIVDDDGGDDSTVIRLWSSPEKEKDSTATIYHAWHATVRLQGRG